MAALNLQLGGLHRTHVHRLLGLVNAGGGLHRGAHHQRHAVGDAAVHAAVVVGGGYHPAVLYGHRIVGHAAPQPGHAEARAELHALHGGNAEQQVGQLAFHAVEEGLARARRQAGDRRFQHAAHAVALTGGGPDGLLHLFAGGLAQHRQAGAGVQRSQLCVQLLFLQSKGLVLHARDARRVGGHPDALCQQDALAQRTRRAQRRGNAAGKMPAAPEVLKAAVFHMGGVVRMARAAQAQGLCVITRAGVGVFDHHGNGGAGGAAIVHAAQKTHLVRLDAAGGKAALFRPPLFHLGGDEFLIHRNARGQTVQHRADGRAVALAEDGQRNGAAVCVFHPITSPSGSPSARLRPACPAASSPGRAPSPP